MGYLPSCFVPTKGHLAAQMSQPLGICSTKVKTMLMPGGGGGGGCISWKHSVLRELVVPVFSKISRGSTFYAGLFASITSAEFKTKFYFETKPYESSADKKNKKLLNFPPFWGKVFLTPAVPLSYQKQC